MNVAITIDDVQPEALISGTEAGPASKRIVVGFGFWIFLLSDIVMFSALFASYAVLVNATAGGPSGAQLFNQVTVAVETACLLFSSYTCGLMSLVGPVAATWRYLFDRRDHFHVGRRIPRSRDPGVRHDDCHRCCSATQRVSFRIFRAGWVPRAARQRRIGLADGHDGPGRGQRLCPQGGAPPVLFRPVLARARHHLGRAIHGRLSDGSSYHDGHTVRSRTWRDARTAPRPKCSSTRPDCFWPSSSPRRLFGSQTRRCSGDPVCPWGLPSSPSHRWAFTWSSSCTSTPRPTTQITCLRSHSAFSSCSS